MDARKAIVAPFVLLLSACGTTSGEMRAAPRETATLTVPLPYAAVVDNFFRRAQGCFNGGTPASHFHATKIDRIDGSLSTVECVQEGVARRVLISADIVPVADGANVTYFIHPQFSVFVTFRPVMEEWSHGEGTRCGTLFD